MPVSITSTSTSALAKVGFSAYTTTGTVPASIAPMTLASVYTDTASGWNGTNTYTIPITGNYTVSFSPTLSPTSAGGTAFIGISRNGTPLPGAAASLPQDGAGQQYNASITITYPFTAGDTVTFTAYQNTGHTVNIIEAVASITSINAATGSGGGGGGSNKAPTQQIFTGGSGTYTLPTSPSPLYIQVIMVGAGGGGSGSAANANYTTSGSPGTSATTFGSSLLTCNPGAPGTMTSQNGAVPGSGGTASISSPAVGVAITGGSGQGGSFAATGTGLTYAGGNGGSSPFGGAGGGGPTNAAGGNASPQSGSGGGGGGIDGTTGATQLNETSGAGGGAGGYVNAIISSLSSTYAYAVGNGGAGGPGFGNANPGFNGGNGGNGMIQVIEYYQ
jgi:hypothetical protein